MILSCTTAAFTIPHFLQMGFVMLCSLTQGFGLLCDFCSSAHRFALRLLSDARSPSRPCLRLVLFKVDSLSPSWKMYRGLTPHKIMPMPGTHNALQRMAESVSGQREPAAPVCPQNRAYGSVHGSSRKTDPLRNLKPMI
jgi:hypothetical protein